jgi:hypothetical protein
MAAVPADGRTGLGVDAALESPFAFSAIANRATHEEEGRDRADSAQRDPFFVETDAGFIGTGGEDAKLRSTTSL